MSREYVVSATEGKLTHVILGRNKTKETSILYCKFQLLLEIRRVYDTEKKFVSASGINFLEMILHANLSSLWPLGLNTWKHLVAQISGSTQENNLHELQCTMQYV